MTSVIDWIDQDARRRAPDFDFGSVWTREHDPNSEWTVSYNTGTGELYAHTRSGDDVEVLGKFADPQDVADALPDWGRRSQEPGSLDWARRETLALQSAKPRLETDDSIYGVVLQTDGGRVALREPQSIDDVAVRISGDLDVAPVNTGDRTERVVMWVDDLGHDKSLPVNAAATQLYGTGWPILGDAMVVTDDQRPLPPHLARSLVPDLDHQSVDLDSASTSPVVNDRVLDWDEHLDDRERSFDSDLDALAEPAEDLDPDLDVDVADLDVDAPILDEDMDIDL